MNIAKQIVGYLKSRSLVLVSVETGTAGAIRRRRSYARLKPE
jgi:hypothetical protein